MVALRSSATATDRIIRLDGIGGGGVPGRLYRIDDELVSLETFEDVPDRVGELHPGTDLTSWIVRRGIDGTTPAAHNIGAAVKAARIAYQSAADLYPPPPFDPAVAGGPHTHPEADVTSLTSDLASKAASGHNHDASYAPTHAHPYAATAHAHLDADLPAGLARDAEVAAAYSVLGHTHAASGSIPTGVIVMWAGLVANIPQGWLLCDGANGTPDLRDRFIKGATGEAGTLAGAATHGHTVTQPADHAALTHAGATVGAHAFTQPSAHTDHGVLVHSAHAGAAVAAHNFTQPGAHSAHAFTQPGAHTNHVVTQPSAHADVLNHVHLEQLQGGTTGTTTGTHLMGSAATGGSLRSAGQATLNPSANGVASQAHSGSAVDAHSAHSGGAVDAHSAHSGGAVDAHGVTQPSAHTDHGTQAHSAHAGGAVDAHTVGQATQHGVQSHAGAAVATASNEPPSYALCFIQKAA